MAAKKINHTSNYDLFHYGDDNRPLAMEQHGSLLESMRKYGFLSSFPISVVRDRKGRLIVKDGQHRLAIARQLGIGVYWIEEEVDYDVAEVSTTSKAWKPLDYAKKYATQGLPDYIEALDFATDRKIVPSIAFALLSGRGTFNSEVRAEFQSGEFRVTHRAWADNVARLFVGMTQVNRKLRASNFMLACAAVCRVPDFDCARMLSAAAKCREKLGQYSTRDAFLAMLESVYNFNRSAKVPLKFLAIQVTNEVKAQKRPA